MTITKEFLVSEIVNAEALRAQAQRQLAIVEGGLSVLNQLKAWLDKDNEPVIVEAECQPETL